MFSAEVLWTELDRIRLRLLLPHLLRLATCLRFLLPLWCYSRGFNMFREHHPGLGRFPARKVRILRE